MDVMWHSLLIRTGYLFLIPVADVLVARSVITGPVARRRIRATAEITAVASAWALVIRKQGTFARITTVCSPAHRIVLENFAAMTAVEEVAATAMVMGHVMTTYAHVALVM